MQHRSLMGKSIKSLFNSVGTNKYFTINL